MKVTGTGLVAPAEGAPSEVTLDGRRLLLRNAPPPTSVNPRDARRLTRLALFALGAAKEALGTAPVEGLGIAFGSGYGSVEATRLALEGLFERADLISPTHFVASVRHDAASAAARLLAIHGPSAALSARRLSFEQALGWALVQLRRERARSMLVVGAEEITPPLARSLSRARLSGETVVDGEGAGALLVEGDDSPRPALARIDRVVEGTGSPDELVLAVKRDLGGRFDRVFTDEDGSARRAECAAHVATAFACEKVAVAERTGHFAAGGALVSVHAVRALSQSNTRTLVYAREADGAYFAYALERP